VSEELFFDLIPVTSIDSRNQPRLMGESEKHLFFDNLSHKSAVELRDTVEKGYLKITTSS
jgi:hypothetical protein